MQLSIAAVLAFASAALAQTAGFDPITKPTEGEKVPAGSIYQIVWQPSAAHPGSIQISLLGGSTPSTLNVVATLATGVDGKAGSFDWQVDKALGSLATYGIKITLESDPNIFQFGFPFKITPSSGGGGSTSASVSVSATSSVSASRPAASSTSTTLAPSSSTTLPPSSSTTLPPSSSTTLPPSSSTTLPPSSSTPLAPSNSTTLASSITHNASTTATGGASLSTLASLGTQKQRPSSTSSSAVTAPTSGGASLAASSFALIGGVAVAVLAL